MVHIEEVADAVGFPRSGAGRLLRAARTIERYWNRIQSARSSSQSSGLPYWRKRVLERENSMVSQSRKRQMVRAPTRRRSSVGAGPKYKRKARVGAVRRKSAPKKLRAKKFSRAKTRRVKPFTRRAILKPPKYGCVFSVEASGLLNGGEAPATERRNPVILGHVTCGSARMFFNGIRALVKLFARKLKMDFKSWDQEVYIDRQPGTGTASAAQIVWNYQNSPTSDLILESYAVPAGFSWDAVALGLANKIKDAFNDNPTGAELTSYQIKSIWWQWNGTSGAAQAIEDQPAFVINAAGIKLWFDCESKLTLQNRTPAVTVGTGDETNRNDIAANPLVGKMYNMTKGYARPRFIPNDAGGHGSLIANQQTGVIVSTITNFNSAVQRQYQAIPYAKAFENVKSCSDVIMPPGDVKHSYCRYKRSMYLNYFLKVIRGCMRQVTDATSVNVAVNNVDHVLAVGRFYLLRKSIHDGSGSDPFPQVAYQIDNKTCVHATHKDKVYTTVFKELT